MRHTLIPNIGAISNSLALRVALAHAVGYVERQGKKRGLFPASGVTLLAALQFCVDRLEALQTELAPEGE
jgi:hypothetical protein